MDSVQEVSMEVATNVRDLFYYSTDNVQKVSINVPELFSSMDSVQEVPELSCSTNSVLDLNIMARSVSYSHPSGHE